MLPVRRDDPNAPLVLVCLPERMYIVEVYIEAIHHLSMDDVIDGSSHRSVPVECRLPRTLTVLVVMHN